MLTEQPKLCLIINTESYQAYQHKLSIEGSRHQKAIGFFESVLNFNY